MKKPIYILAPNVSGTLWTKLPPFPREQGGKFVLNADLNQDELKFLYEDCSETSIITKVIPENKAQGEALKTRVKDKESLKD